LQQAELENDGSAEFVDRPELAPDLLQVSQTRTPGWNMYPLLKRDQAPRTVS